MSRELDTRDVPSATRRADRARRLAGTITAVASAAPRRGDYVSRALTHVQALAPDLGVAGGRPPEYVPDPQPLETTSGAVAVHLAQQLHGIPVFGAAETVRFRPDGAVDGTEGSTVPVDAAPETVTTGIGVREAVRAAATHVAEPREDERGRRDQFGEPLEPARADLTGFEPEVLATFQDTADRRTVLARGPFEEDVRAGLVWFPRSPADLRLAWQVLLTMPGGHEQFRVLVDADSGAVLYCKQLVVHAAARGRVYRVDGGSPREELPFPQPLSAYAPWTGAGLPAGFPDDWVATDAAEGNAVRAHLGDRGPTMRGRTGADGVVVFDPADDTGDDQKVLNIFFFNGVMHDLFYLLGFREADGNFQRDNLGRGGLANDRVDARAYSGPVQGTASMATPADGNAPIMRMGLVTSTDRHTAFDAGVVFHEFMHGVTNRLVGGPLNAAALEEPQSAGMGEGWGDYVACTLNATDVVGAWVVDDPAGIRRHPYDADFPDGFGALGTPDYEEVHDIGELWCATLMEVNRRIGRELALPLVVDALKLSPANPSFLDMRDAILAALDAKREAGQVDDDEHARARSGLWAAFAKFGMGVDARSAGASLEGIVADDSVPADAVAA